MSKNVENSFLLSGGGWALGAVGQN